jgi:hypothetical protein
MWPGKQSISRQQLLQLGLLIYSSDLVQRELIPALANKIQTWAQGKPTKTRYKRPKASC